VPPDEPRQVPRRLKKLKKRRSQGSALLCLHMENSPLLLIENLVTAFPIKGNRTLTAVDGVDLSIPRGEIVGLVGESGSGKSVLAMSVMGLIDPPGMILRGKVVFDGIDLLRLSEDDMRKRRGSSIAMIFQNPSACLNPVRRIGSQLESVLKLHGSSNPEAEALEWLREVHIADPARVRQSYPHELSGGMCQRVMVAMALSCRPKLLIADEPTASLDVTIQAQLIRLLLELRERHSMSILFISHDLGVVAQACDQVAVMYLGRIVEYAQSVDFYRAPQHPYSRALLAAVPSTDVTQRRTFELLGELPSPEGVPKHSCRFHSRCSEAEDICLQEDPALHAVGDGHFVACLKRLWKKAEN
jgi:peptide/nickel transport system ATP-binding protein